MRTQMHDSSKEIKSNKGYFQNSRSEMLKFIPESSQIILEVGCGEGNFLRQLKSDSRELWGIELNVDAASKATEVCDFAFSGDFDSQSTGMPYRCDSGMRRCRAGGSTASQYRSGRYSPLVQSSHA